MRSGCVSISPRIMASDGAVSQVVFRSLRRLLRTCVIDSERDDRRHCEERSDAAIQAAARLEARWIATPLRGSR